MRCTATELEIETIFTRINSKDFNLQPDFQRGEVWSLPKKRKLIDSILRGWRIPPIHVIENKNFVDEVLDGQQRLATIRDFLNDEIKIDGTLVPIDDKISELDGLKFSKLDSDTKRKFRKYSVTLIRLTEYTPEEPAELFYRLNQPATLTSAEQRNAFVGNTRSQIRELVEKFEEAGAKKDTIGFSNSRMAYDDVISKYCYVLEQGTVKKKVTSTQISEKYRKNEGFSNEIIEKVDKVLHFFIVGALVSKDTYGRNLSLNKATLFSWLIFLNRYISKLSVKELGELLFGFEQGRQHAKGKVEYDLFDILDNRPNLSVEFPFYHSMFLIFNQRASMGSTDATSIIYRDIILEMFVLMYFKERTFNEEFFNNLIQYYTNNKENLSHTIEMLSDTYNWGAAI
jgi:hypothetical protein